jgi:GNAT superfamily N-acetyltransferase
MRQSVDPWKFARSDPALDLRYQRLGSRAPTRLCRAQPPGEHWDAMAELNVEEFESELDIRKITIEDFESLVELQKKCFPGIATWKREHIESQLLHFPDGQICIEFDGKIVASSSSLIVDFGDYDEWHSWMLIADGGFIRNHDESGDSLYGIEIMVHPEYRGYRLSRRLYEARKQIARQHNLRRIIIGGRIPGYGEHADRLTAREYIDEVIAPVSTIPSSRPSYRTAFRCRG